MSKPVSQFNVWRHSEKQKLASYFRVNGVCGLRQIRPSDAQHPYATLCQREVIEYGLYLSNTGSVWQYLRAIGPDHNVDAKVVALCKGTNASPILSQTNAKSRNVAIIKRPTMDWQCLTPHDYNLLLHDCRTLMNILQQV